MPPEAFGETDLEIGELLAGSQWDIAVRYHDLKNKKGLAQHSARLREISAEAVLDQARAVLGSIVHPTTAGSASLDTIPFDAENIELSVDTTLEESFERIHLSTVSPADLWMDFQTPKKQAVVLCLSMTGEKLALTAVAIAVVLLQFPDAPIGVVAFENEAKILKAPDERISSAELVERFLDVPAQGYTHLEKGMKAALLLTKIAESQLRGQPPSTVLLTDGKYTAGRDPAYLAPRFSRLMVLKMGQELASLSLCQEMAKKGGGKLMEVGELEHLPQVMYGVVKDLLRGGNQSYR